jgi:hypothetical protein
LKQLAIQHVESCRVGKQSNKFEFLDLDLTTDTRTYIHCIPLVSSWKLPTCLYVATLFIHRRVIFCCSLLCTKVLNIPPKLKRFCIAIIATWCTAWTLLDTFGTPFQFDLRRLQSAAAAPSILVPVQSVATRSNAKHCANYIKLSHLEDNPSKVLKKCVPHAVHSQQLQVACQCRTSKSDS